MLRNLVDEMVRRRLWPVAALAVAVVAAPLLFLKSAPPEAVSDAAVAPATAQADLPARAQRLLTTTDAGSTSRKRLSRSKRDPFQAPASRGAKAASARVKASARKASAKKASSSESDGTSSGGSASTSGTSAARGGSSSSSATSTSRSTRTSTSPSTDPPAIDPTVDVRFGAHKDSPIQRRIPRLKRWTVDGDVLLIFVKYSPSRHKAVFMVPSTTIVRGDVDCRHTDGVCYVDIPAGKYARLTFTTSDGLRVSRRLDVVRFHDA